MSKRYPLILSMDTSTRCSTVSLTRGAPGDGEVLAALSLSSGITHSRRLIKSVEKLFLETGTTWSDVGAIGLGLGPGSFTGLRIGLATAKGFAVAAKIPLVGVTTLEALAAGCISSRPICSVLDARKKQVYVGMYRIDHRGFPVIQGDLRVLYPEDLAEHIQEPVIMVGDGILPYRDLWQGMLGDLVTFAPAHLNVIQASVIGFLCGVHLKNGNYADIDSVSPIYVRASDAELSLLNKEQQKSARSNQ